MVLDNNNIIQCSKLIHQPCNRIFVFVFVFLFIYSSHKQKTTNLL